MPNVSELLRDCVEVGFVLSPAFSDEGFEEVFRLMVEKFNIPYTKGVRNEHDFCAIRKPPHRKRK